MKTLKSNTIGNISTTLTKLGANSIFFWLDSYTFRVSQAYLGKTPGQLEMTFFENIDDATKHFNNLTK
tara:strand:+ start:351 stop:554 length:204 start_codon:yes stop_codon:yes gene_type:complete